MFSIVSQPAIANELSGNSSMLIAQTLPLNRTYTIEMENPQGQRGIFASWDAHRGLVNGGNQILLSTGNYDTCIKNDCDFILKPKIEVWERLIKIPNVALYGGAPDSMWKQKVRYESGISLEDAKKIAKDDDNIGFFFYMREYMVLPGRGQFKPQDAVFFSGDPWWGSAPQADGYIKAHLEWTKVPDVAQYGEADWSAEVTRVSNITLEQAKEIAEGDPNINFFFYMRYGMVLPTKGTFNPRDAVFFSGKPWWGSAPQADGYYKSVINWSKKPNVAQYGGADWNNLVKKVSGVTLEAAQQIGAEDPNINFFFYMREPMTLPGKGTFLPQDAVYFSGKPWYGSAPQADAYEKIEQPVWDVNS
ncbi:hypothetical protein [Moorena producens]|uniref:hypothetical protein n=1 Tax=Moorena producens TaxID=1155739 RepID=UPI003C74A3A4